MIKLLRDTQRAFADALTQPDTEARVLDTMSGDERRNRNRLALYRGNLTQSWHNVLAATYPVLRALTGDDFFHALAREYGKKYPSGSGDLNRFGHRLADLLRVWPPCSPYPYFADITRLEWAVHRAHFAADMSPLPPEGWLQHDPDVLADSPVILHPAVELVSSPWRIADIWLAHQGTSPATVGGDIQRPQHVVVARPLWKARVIPLSHAAFCALDALRRGEAMGRAIDAAHVQDTTFDFASNWRIWVEQAIVIAPIVPQPPKNKPDFSERP
jgi:hypothetical protein